VHARLREQGVIMRDAHGRALDVDVETTTASLA
jgi:hypothetical protein